jgi:4,5-dihydroxyphthalate decarboxylase
MSATTTEKIQTLSVCFGTYPHTQALKSGAITSDRVALHFTEVNPVNRAFMPMAREQKFDVCEMAIVTYLQAKAYGKPLMLMPATMMGRFQHGTMLYNSERGTLRPEDLPGPQGRRAGVLADHGRVDPRHPLEGLRARSQQSEMGDVRGRARRRVPRSAGRRARRRRQGHHQNAARRRTRRRDLRRRHADRSASSKASFPIPRRRRRNGTKRTASCRSITWSCSRRACRSRIPARCAKSSACCSTARRRPACRKPAPSTPFRSASTPSNRRSILMSSYALEMKLTPRRYAVEELFDDTTRCCKPDWSRPPPSTRRTRGRSAGRLRYRQARRQCRS